MPTQFILDTREKSLQALFTRNSIPFKTRQLDLGDVLILYSKGEIRDPSTEPSDKAKKLLLGSSKAEEKIESEHPVHTIVLERKSYTDLKASMSDGRYHEQKSRYMQLPRGTIYYLLENNDPKFAELDYKAFLGAYVHTMIRDDIQVFNTTSIQQTYEFLLKIAHTLEEFGFNARESKVGSTESTQIKKKKAVGKEVYKAQICCIPGISSAKADPIVAAYPNMSVLLAALESGNFQVKGIGKVLVQRITESLILSEPKASTKLVFG